MADPASAAPRQNGSSYTATAFTVVAIHTAVASAASRNAAGSPGVNAICSTARAGGTATTT